MRHVLSVALGVLLVAGCMTAARTDTAAPLLVRGVVHDNAERPIADATVSMTASGPVSSGTDEPGPVVFEARVVGGPDGTFQFRAAPNDALRAAANAGSGTVRFFLSARDAPGTSLGSWEFGRTLAADGWSGDAPAVVLRPVNSGPDGCC